MFNKNKKSEQKENRPSVVTRETVGVTLGVFSVLVLLISFTGNLLFGEIGTAITSFLFGAFGFMTYFVFLALLYLGVVLVTGKNFIPGRMMTASGFCLVALIGLLVHAAVTAGYPQTNYGEFLSACFAAGENGAFGCTPFGLIGGLVTYPVTALASHAGAYILFSAGIVLCLYLFVNSVLRYKGIRLSFGALRGKDKTNGKETTQGENQNARPVSFSELDNVRVPQGAEEDLPYGGMYADSSYGGQNGASSAAPSYNEPPAPSYSAPAAPSYGAPAAPDRAYGTKNYYGNAGTGNGNIDRGGYGYGYGDATRQGYADGRPSSDRPFSSVQPQGQQSYTGGMSAETGRNVLYGKNEGKEGREEDYSSPDRNKNILYGSGNPADYRNRNLIFDSSSHYNNRPQASTPQDGGKGEASTVQTGYSASSYTDMYAKGIDGNNAPAAHPREVVREDGSTPAAYSMYKKDVFGAYDPAPQNAAGQAGEIYEESYDGADQSEPIRPSYHAPVDTSAVKRSQDVTPPARNNAVRAEQEESAVRTDTETGFRSSRGGEAQPSARVKLNEELPRTQAEEESGRNMTLGERFRADREMQAAERPLPRQTPQRGVLPADDDDGDPLFSSEKEGLFDGDFGSDTEQDREDDVADFRIDSSRELSADRGREGLSSAMRDRTDRGERTDRLPDRGGDRMPPSRDRMDVPERGNIVPPAREGSLSAAEGISASAPAPAPVPASVPAKPKPRVFKEYVRPTLEIFDDYPDSLSVSNEEIEWSKQGIVETLEGFGIAVEIVAVKVGPTFTRYDINFPKNVTVKSIARCADNIAMALRAEKINIMSNFSQGTIAIEVPNRKRSTVGMRTMLRAEEYVNAKPGSLTFCLGKNIEGKPVCSSLVKMTHLLVAGTSGSGKSVFLHQLIVSLIMKYSPEEMRLILIDPKGNEFAAYRGLPNLMVNEIISDVNKAIVVLNWLINEMEHRYTLFTQMTETGKVVRNIDEYNAAVSERADRLPKIVVVADELADFMLQAKKDVEDRIGRLAAKARAAGIHLVLATQRPSVDIITGVLKSNLSSRVALRVGAEVDSRVILDESGAENLLGAGDLLYKTGSMFSMERVQGAWISDKELQGLCNFIREHNEAYYDETAAEFIDSGGKSAGNGNVGDDAGDGEVEPVYIDALRYVVQSGSASISMIQRKCSVGYNKAGKIIEWMEMSGYISPFEGAKSRKVLLTADEFREKYGEL